MTFSIINTATATRTELQQFIKSNRPDGSYKANGKNADLRRTANELIDYLTDEAGKDAAATNFETVTDEQWAELEAFQAEGLSLAFEACPAAEDGSQAPIVPNFHSTVEAAPTVTPVAQSEPMQPVAINDPWIQAIPVTQPESDSSTVEAEIVILLPVLLILFALQIARGILVIAGAFALWALRVVQTNRKANQIANAKRDRNPNSTLIPIGA